MLHYVIIQGRFIIILFALSYLIICVITSVSLLPFLPQGPLGVAVTYGGDHIPKSPFNVAVAPTLDLSKINVTGLGDSTY